MSLLQLFINFLYVGLFSVGGGYAAIPLIQSRIVGAMGWLSMEEFTNLVTIAEMTPGPIAVNAATFVGVHIAGPAGAVFATFGCIFPSLILVSALFFLYRRFRSTDSVSGVLGCLRPAVVALIASAGVSMLQLVFLREGQIKWIEGSLCVVAFIALRRFKTSPVLTMLACGLIGLALHTVTGGIL